MRQAIQDVAGRRQPRPSAVAAGLPMLMNGQVVGAVAVSGLPEMLDMEMAQLGVAAITGA